MTDEELVLSASSVNAYWKCHYAWKLSNVLRIPAVGNLAMALGQSVHQAIEAIFTSPLRPENVLRAAFIKETAGLPTEEMNSDPGALADGQAMLATYTREVLPTYHPTLVEAPFTIRTEGILLSGVIDNADEDVHDVKTTSLISRFRPENHQFQLTLYHWGYAALTGRAPRRLLLDVLPRGGKIRHRQIEVKPAHGDAIDLIRLTASSIMRRDYSPTGALNGSCERCPYRLSCQFSTVKEIPVV